MNRTRRAQNLRCAGYTHPKCIYKRRNEISVGERIDSSKWEKTSEQKETERRVKTKGDKKDRTETKHKRILTLKMCSTSSKHGVERFGDGENASTSPSISPKPRRPRARRVQYPPGLRKIVPKEESDPAIRWLLLLSALLFLQIYTEEGLSDTQGVPDRAQAQDDPCTLEENPFSREGASEADVAQCWGIEQSCNLCWEMRSCF
jgi:hypothetical protein